MMSPGAQKKPNCSEQDKEKALLEGEKWENVVVL